MKRMITMIEYDDDYDDDHCEDLDPHHSYIIMIELPFAEL
jgi:hypothetical protein